MIFYIEPDEVEEPEIVSSIIPSSWLGEDTGEPDESPSSFYDIYFVKGKADILQKSFKALDLLTTNLLNHPTVEIMIIGHTDNVGDESALFDLSVKRAESIRQFLVGQGVAHTRIQAMGVGATKPLFDNSSESNRERNRRVEIKVIKS